MKYLICTVAGMLIGVIVFYLLIKIMAVKQKRKRINKGKQEKKKKAKPNFTKLLLSLILLTYFVGLILGIYVTIQDFSQFGVLATYIATPTTTVIALYCWKSKAENIIKLKQGFPEETKDISIDLNNIL